MSDEQRMKELLDGNHSWPSEYMFKFIVSIDKISEILTILGEEGKISKRPSKNGNYISVTQVRVCESADDVIRVYKLVQVIEGIVTL